MFNYQQNQSCDWANMSWETKKHSNDFRKPVILGFPYYEFILSAVEGLFLILAQEFRGE
jgi:hypothetical protein